MISAPQATREWPNVCQRALAEQASKTSLRVRQ
jgi:hypothetical protein